RFRSLFEQLEHFRLNVHGPHDSFGSHKLGKLQRVESIAASEIADRLTLFDLQGFEQLSTLFLSLARLADEPRRSGVVHRFGDAATHVLGGLWALDVRLLSERIASEN